MLELIAEVNNKQVFLIGDFNYPDIEWSRLQAKSEASQRFVDCMEDSYLTQHVTGATRGGNVLDLVITSDPGMISKVNILGQFAKTDHSQLQWETEVMVTSKPAFRPTLDYGKANYPLMRKKLKYGLLLLFNLYGAHHMLTPRGALHYKIKIRIGNGYAKLNRRMLDYIQKHNQRSGLQVHSSEKPNQRGCKKALWMTNKAVQLMRQKYKTFAKHNDSLHPACIRAAMAADKEVEDAKVNFEMRLADNIKTDSESFFAYVSE